MSDTELSAALVELRRLENRLEHTATRLTGDWDARKAWAGDHARSGASWLAFRTHMPGPTARRRVRLARATREMPEVTTAWAAGDIESAHVSAMASARTPVTAEVFARDESVLLDEARRLRFDDFTRVVAYWSQHADPDGAEHDARALHAQRHAHLSQTFGGAWAATLGFDPIGGAIVDTTLRMIEREMFDADRADARERLGREPTSGDLTRTPAQRRADAFVEMATRARTAPEHGRRPAPLFTLFVGYETFAGRVCELANGAALTPGSLVPWLPEAYIERMVFDTPSRVVDVGAQRRLFDGATRRAIQARDRNRCYEPSCDTHHDLQVDHIEPWSAGGTTIQTNGRLACGLHNRARTRPPP